MRYLLIFCFLYGVLSYGQTTTDLFDILEGDPYLKKLQKYDYEPQYQIEIESYYDYVIKVNDMPVTNQRPPLGQTLFYPINTNILESGIQTLSFDIYPRYIEATGEQKEFFENPERIDFKIVVYQTAWINGFLEPKKNVLVYTLSEDSEMIKNITQKTHIHKELTFNATVPYKLKGWSESKVFNPKDSVELEKKVHNFYLKYRQLMEDRKGIEIIKISPNQIYETAQSFYFTRDQVLNIHKEFLEQLSKQTFVMAPIDKDYKLIFYGNNRVLGLVFTDEQEKGESCMNKLKMDKNGEWTYNYITVLLHQPKGSNKLERIR